MAFTDEQIQEIAKQKAWSNTTYANGSLTAQNVRDIFRLYSEGVTQKEIAKLYNIGQTFTSKLLKGQMYPFNKVPIDPNVLSLVNAIRQKHQDRANKRNEGLAARKKEALEAPSVEATETSTPQADALSAHAAAVKHQENSQTLETMTVEQLEAILKDKKEANRKADLIKQIRQETLISSKEG